MIIDGTNPLRTLWSTNGNFINGVSAHVDSLERNTRICFYRPETLRQHPLNLWSYLGVNLTMHSLGPLAIIS